ncbi:MAG: DUF5667 domain-containing protein [bacterium]
MFKKIILGLIFATLLLFCTSALAQTNTRVKPGMLPDSPWYFLDRVGESVRTFFTFGKSKAERHIELAEERLAEIDSLNKKGKTEIAEKVTGDYDKEIDRVLLKIKKFPDKDIKSDELLIKLVKKNQDHQKMLVELFNKAPQASKQRLKLKLTNEKKKYLDLVDQISDSKQEAVLNILKSEQDSLDKKIEKLELQTSTESNKRVDFLNKPPLSDEESLLQIKDIPTQGGGKPGMSEDGSTQVTNPQGGSGNSCSKLYICKINCGKDIIEKCNGYSSNKMYQLLQCRGGCYKYNIFYGCGMEAGCDESCWQDYNTVCSPNKYESCISSCEGVFGDC